MQLGQMQKQGTLQLNSKIAYAVGKNINACNVQGKDFEEYKHKLMVLHVEQDSKGKFGTIPVNGQNEWQFKTDADKDNFLDSLEKYLDEEINFNEFKISLEDLKQVHNMPVDTLALLEEFGILTEISLAGGNLKIMN